jgi:type IV pilus assembly protein PilE
MPRLQRRRLSDPHGFTLIEVMVTVAIVAILASIALPSYSTYIQRSRVPVALDSLASYFTRIEQRYQDVGNYSDGGTACWGASTLPTMESFSVTCTLTNSGQGFTATATGSGRMNGYTYTINHLGARATTSHPNGSNSACWTTKGGACDT